MLPKRSIALDPLMGGIKVGGRSEMSGVSLMIMEEVVSDAMRSHSMFNQTDNGCVPVTGSGNSKSSPLL